MQLSARLRPDLAAALARSCPVIPTCDGIHSIVSCTDLASAISFKMVFISSWWFLFESFIILFTARSESVHMRHGLDSLFTIVMYLIALDIAMSSDSIHVK